MKIRHGFVSNSSTSSFCIFGAEIDKDIFLDKMRKLNPKIDVMFALFEEREKFNEGDTIDYEAPSIDDVKEDALEIAEEMLMKMGLEIETAGYEGDYYYIGRDFTSIKRNETRNQFETSIKKAVKKLFPKQKCTLYEGTYQS